MAEKQRTRKRPVRLEGSPESQNARRVEWARRAVARLKHETGLTNADGLDTAIVDLICDLLHLCNREGLEFEHVLALAKLHYDAETRGA